MSKYKRIFIIGHSGAGKGVLAKKLAETLGWKFINADVFGGFANVGRTQYEVFGEDGARSFGKCLTDILKYQVTQNNIVVATDESIICNNSSCDLLKKEFTLYLEISIPVQIERLADYRPLLPTANYNLLLQELHKRQNKLYEGVAKHVFNSDNEGVQSHIEKIKNLIKD